MPKPAAAAPRRHAGPIARAGHPPVRRRQSRRQSHIRWWRTHCRRHRTNTPCVRATPPGQRAAPVLTRRTSDPDRAQRRNRPPGPCSSRPIATGFQGNHNFFTRSANPRPSSSEEHGLSHGLHDRDEPDQATRSQAFPSPHGRLDDFGTPAVATAACRNPSDARDASDSIRPVVAASTWDVRQG